MFSLMFISINSTFSQIIFRESSGASISRGSYVDYVYLHFVLLELHCNVDVGQLLMVYGYMDITEICFAS